MVDDELVERPVAEWAGMMFAAVDARRRTYCTDASGSGGDPPCWRCLPEAYASDECAAGCGARAVVDTITALKAEIAEVRLCAEEIVWESARR